MKTITLTMLQRFGLEGLLGDQKGKRENNAVFYRIRKKVKVPAETRSRIVRDLPVVGDGIFDEYPPVSLELETEEVRKLRKLGEDAELPVSQMDWLEPIMEQLEAK